MKTNTLIKFLHLVLLLTMVISITAVQPVEVQAAQFQKNKVHTGFEKSEPQTYVSNRLLIKFKDDLLFSESKNIDTLTGINTLDALMKMQGVTNASPLTSFSAAKNQRTGLVPLIYRLDLDGKRDAEEAAKALSMDPNIEWVEPDYIAKAILTPNDPDYSLQWGLSKIEAETAWNTETGSNAVVIAVIDSGIDLSHPDLVNNLWVNPGEIAGNGIDDDNNSHIDDINGWNFVGGDANISDINGHGTQVSGIAAAESNNAAAIAGLCWHCQIMPVRVMSGAGNANYSDVAAGVMYAADKGVDVINLSLGGYSYSNALKEAIDYAVGEGVVVIAGAGNDNLESMFYPAAYSTVLAVAATDQNDLKAGYSNYGDWVDVSAPGVDIQTTFLGGDTGSSSGSSLSSPFAAGLAGLIRSQHADWSEVMVRNQIIQTTDVIDSTNPTYAGKLGSGRINAAAAMTAPQPLIKISSILVDGEINGRPTPGNTVELVLPLSNDWWDAGNVNAVLSTSDPYITLTSANAGYGTIVSGATVNNSTPFRFTVSSTAGYNHVINFNLRVTANSGAYVVNLPFSVTTRSENEHFCGTIAQNTLWTNDKIYLIDCNVGVAPGYTLTIEGGTEIVFTGNYAFNIGGDLIAHGTRENPIKFSGKDEINWNQIYLDNTTSDASVDLDMDYLSGSILQYVEISNATNGIICNQSSPYLSDINLTDSGINCSPGDLTINGEVITSSNLLFNSNIYSDISFGGVVFLKNSQTEYGNLTVNSYAELEENTINGNTYIGYTAESGISLIKNNMFLGNFDCGSGISCEITGNKFSRGDVRIGGPGIIIGNTIENAPSWAITSHTNVTIESNRIIANENGIRFSGGTLSGNLIANQAGIGLQISGSANIENNTFTGNEGNSIKISGGTEVTITNNNLEGNFGQFDIEDTVSKTTLATVTAQNNWWGTTSTSTIQNRIFDFNRDYTIGTVLFTPALSQPVVDAPAYVRSVTLDPESPVGIQTVNFDVEFSKPMDADIFPEMGFYSAKKETWESFSIPDENFEFYDIVGHPNGNMWAATSLGAYVFDGTNWFHIKHPLDNEWESSYLHHVAIHPDGSIWFVNSWRNKLFRYDGTNWMVFSSIEFYFSDIKDFFIQGNGVVWIITSDGAINFDGTNYKIFSTDNSEIPTNEIYCGLAHPDGSVWFATSAGAVQFDGVTWKKYTIGLDPDEQVINDITIDSNGVLWALHSGNLYKFTGKTWEFVEIYNLAQYLWKVYPGIDGDLWFNTAGDGLLRIDQNKNFFFLTTENSGLLDNDTYQIVFQENSSVWITYISSSFRNKITVKYNRPTYPIQNNVYQINQLHWQGSYDFTSMIERGDYRFEISGAAGEDGMEIAPFNNLIFTVDYAGYIDDDTPPSKPIVEACSYTQVDKLSASWSVVDPESTVDLYRYAIGTTPGGTEVVNWTTTSSTSFERTGLTLVPGKSYYISVQARNEGGLWSEIGTPDAVISGTALCTANISSVYLPLLTR